MNQPNRFKNRRWILSVSLALILVASSVTVGVTAHSTLNQAGESAGFEWPDVDPEYTSQFDIWGWTFAGRPTSDKNPIPDTPCNDILWLDLVRQEDTGWGTPYGTPPNQVARDHMGHIYAARWMHDYDEDDPADQSAWTWAADESVINYHLDTQYEGGENFEGPWDGTAGSEQVMLGTDGYLDFHFNKTVWNEPGDDVIVVDYHPHSSYCVWGKPDFAKAGDPWLFMGSAFINPAYDWDADGMDDFGGEAGASVIELGLYYDEILRTQYPWYPDDEPARVHNFLLQASLDKYPAVRADFFWNVTPIAEQRAWTQPPEQKDNGPLGIRYQDPNYPVSTIDYAYEFQNEVIQEHWINLTETATRYGWPERTDIFDNSPDPLYAWEWYIDTDPDPTQSTAFQVRNCPTDCDADYPFPNPYRLPVLPQEFYVDDPHNDGTSGEYQICLFVYTDEAVGKGGKAPNMAAYQNGDPNALQRADETNSDMQCKILEVKNIKPVPLVREEPVWKAGETKPRTRSFLAEPWDPDSIPQCVDGYRWDFDSEPGSFEVMEWETGHLRYAERFQPTHTFDNDGLKQLNYQVRDCNGLWSDVRSIYLHIPPNKAPILDRIGTQRIAVGENWCRTVSAHDPDGYDLDAISHGGLPPGMTPKEPPVDNEPFQICWTPELGQAGPWENYHLYARDDLGAVDEEFATFVVYVPGVDSDNDGVLDEIDNCPKTQNKDQLDADNNGVGDACQQIFAKTEEIKRQSGPLAPGDIDRDGVADESDNCRLIPNKNQNDLDLDGIGDVCDSDMDGDGILQVAEEADAFLDNCPRTPNTDQRDSNNDGIGDACDETSFFSDTALRAGGVRANQCTDETCDEQTRLAEQFNAPEEDQSGRFMMITIISVVVGIALLVPLIMWARRAWKE